MRAAGSAARSSAGVAGFRGVVSGVLRGLAVSRSLGGSGAPAGRVAGLLVALAVLAFPASGWATKYFDSTVGVNGSTTGGTFGNAPRDVAVNEPSVNDGNAAANGDFYVVDDVNHRIQRLNADGSFDLMWGADVDSSVVGANFEVCAVAANCKVGVASPGNAGDNLRNGALDNPQGIAVDQDTGSVYVSDRDNRRVSQYTADGVFVRSFGFDVDATTAGVGYEVCPAADRCKVGLGVNNASATSPGPNPGQYSAGTTANGYRIDVSKPDGNPATGKVYLANTGSRRVEVFNLDGSAPAAIGATTNFGTGQPLHVAVDSDEIVYATAGVAQRIVRYDAAGAAFLDPLDVTAVTSVDGATGILGARLGLEVDRSSGNLLVTTFGPETGVIEIAAPASAPSFVDAHRTTGPSVSFVPTGLGIDPDTGVLYAPAPDTSGILQGRIVRFDEDGLGPMSLVPQPATNVGATSATLAATINPAVNGPTGQPTSYRFEVSKTGIDGSWVALGADVQVPPNGDTDADTLVQAAATGLEANSSYRYRVVATRANNTGQTISGEGFFLTDPAPPTVSSLRVNQVRDTTVDLRGRINPNNQTTSYRFRYGIVGAGGEQLTPPQTLAAGGSPVPVREQIDGLQPDSTYQYTLEATNATGTTTASDTFTTLAEMEPETACPNQQFRTGPSANLPDCRAYEMVSPLDKNGGDIATATEDVGDGSRLHTAYRQASITGEKVTYSSATAFGDVVGAHFSNQYISSRGEQGWSTHGISSRRHQSVLEPTGPPILANFRWFTRTFFAAFTPDLSSAWVRDDNVDPLTDDALEGVVNVYRRDNTNDSYHALTNEGPYGPVLPPGDAGFGVGTRVDFGVNHSEGGPRFVGASDDLSHQVFVATAALTSDAALSPGFGTPPTQLYDHHDGELHLVSVLPDGTPSTQPSMAGKSGNLFSLASQYHSLKNAVSDDGSRIFWSYGSGDLFVRLNSGQDESVGCVQPGKACTVQIAAGGDVWFWAASADGSKVLYSTGNHPNRVLSIYDVGAGASTQIAAQSAGVAATADDLSHIYLVSREALAPGAVAGQNNLYDYHGGVHTLIGVVTADDITKRAQVLNGSDIVSANLVGDFDRPTPVYNQTRATADGRHFAFMSNSAALAESVAGYDNRDAVTGDPAFEVYRYDADAGELACVSCRPSGERPVGVLLRQPYAALPSDLTNFPHLRVAASIPTWEHDMHASRVLSDDGGRLFFHSDDRLLAGDVNGVQDVYQWVAEGSHGCDPSDEEFSAQNDGCLSLISTATDGSKSEFFDADPDGDNVFFSTDQSIDPRDTGLRDVYVARVGGGFPAPPPPPPAACEAAAGSCQGGDVGAVGSGETTSSKAADGNASQGARMRLSVAIAASARARRLAVRSGVLRLAVAASEPGVVRALARARVSGKTRRVAGKRLRIRKAGRSVVSLRLSRAARRQLSRGGALRVTVGVTSAGARPRTATVLLRGVKS